MKVRPRLMLTVMGLVLAACTTSESVPDGVVDRLLVTGADGSVTIVDAAGEVVEELATGSEVGGPVQATSSPDGTAVIWTRGPSSRLWSDGEVMAVEPDFTPFFYLWSPDSSQVLALGNDPAEAAVRAVLIDRQGSVEVVVVDRPIYAQWLDEAQLVMHLGSRHLAITGGGEPAVFAGGSPSFLAPDVLDGQVVTVGESTGELTVSAVEVPVQAAGESVSLVDPESGDTRTVYDFTDAVSFAANPDQERIAVLDGRRGSGFLAGDLFVIDVDDGGEPVQITDDPVMIFEWSRDGRELLMFTAAEDANLQPAVWDGESLVSYPAFSPTPSLIVEYLPFWDQYERSVSFWAPDGSGFAYPAMVDGDGAVFIQSLDEDEPGQLTDGVFVSWIQGG